MLEVKGVGMLSDSMCCSDERGNSQSIIVSYDWFPSICSGCCGIGHLVEACRKRGEGAPAQPEHRRQQLKQKEMLRPNPIPLQRPVLQVYVQKHTKHNIDPNEEKGKVIELEKEVTSAKDKDICLRGTDESSPITLQNGSKDSNIGEGTFNTRKILTRLVRNDGSPGPGTVGGMSFLEALSKSKNCKKKGITDGVVESGSDSAAPFNSNHD